LSSLKASLDCEEEDLNLQESFVVLCCKRCKTNDLILALLIFIKKNERKSLFKKLFVAIIKIIKRGEYNI